MHIEIYCEEQLPIPLNGFIEFNPDSVPPFDYLTDAVYSCDPGFRIVSGDEVRRCVGSAEGSGEWSGTAPICEGKQDKYKIELLYTIFLLNYIHGNTVWFGGGGGVFI